MFLDIQQLFKLIVDRFTYIKERLRDMYVTVSQEEANILYTPGVKDNLCAYHDGPLEDFYTLMTCSPPITGQFVQIQLYAYEHLNLYEVEVHGY